MRAVLIVHGGGIVYERYSLNRADAPSSSMPGFSIAKSLTSALVGILVRDGRLDVDAPAPVGPGGPSPTPAAPSRLTTCCA